MPARPMTYRILLIGMAGLCLAQVAAAQSPGIDAADRHELLRLRSDGLPATAGGEPLFQDVGGVAGGDGAGFRGGVAMPMMLSLLMPGLGEATLGHKRGYVMMALDIGMWVAAKSYHDKGNDKKEEYYAFAEAHWDTSANVDPLTGAQWGMAHHYQAQGAGFDYYDESDFHDLSLWVSPEDDRREYYENLGKWDQFVFGWDDFNDPRNFLDVGITADTRNLTDPRTSANRELYRAMRIDSNDQFANRDKVIMINLGHRLLSMLQVAWLQGAIGGRDGYDIAGHRVGLINEPRGFSAGRIGLSLSY